MLAHFDVQELEEALIRSRSTVLGSLNFQSIFSLKATTEPSRADRFFSRKATGSEKEFPVFCSRSKASKATENGVIDGGIVRSGEFL